MKRRNCVVALFLTLVMLLSACSDPVGPGGDGNQGTEVLPFPEAAFSGTQRQSVVGSIIQAGDGNAYVNGAVQGPRALTISAVFDPASVSGVSNPLVTFEHAFGDRCYVSGYIGHSLYIIQDFGSLMANRKGVGHKDGTVLFEYGNAGYFSISSFSENKIIVGNPDEDTLGTQQWSDTFSFGYMTYDPETRSFAPLYAENNLRFYTAGYFINGVAQVSVKQDGKILFGVIDAAGNYIVEPKYDLMADESANGLVIVALDSEPAGVDEYYKDGCGRTIAYDGTLMTELQKTRYYERKSSTVGLLNVQTGENALPCQYAYIERVRENTYFLVDNEGKRFLYDAEAKSFTDVESGGYSYFNSDWMLYTVSGTEGYLVDKNMQRYELTDQNFADFITRSNFRTSLCVNTNIVSAICDEEVKKAAEGRLTLVNRGVEGDYDRDAGLYPKITVTATGEVLENVRSFTYPYNGGFLYTKENSVYRYDIGTKTSKKIETGYGDYIEDYAGWGATYHAELGEIDAGVYGVYYNTVYPDGSRSRFMIIISDIGTVLYDTAISELQQLQKNYLGKYDSALYEFVGTTAVEDNYYFTREDGEHFLISFVRGQFSADAEGGKDKPETERTIGDLTTFALLSPFQLDFAKGGQISVQICGFDIPPEYYAYQSEEQTLKIFAQVVDYQGEILNRLLSDRMIEIFVTSGEETKTLVIHISPFALWI